MVGDVCIRWRYPNPTIHKVSRFYFLIVPFVLPLTIMLFCNISIIRMLTKRVEQNNLQASSNSNNANFFQSAKRNTTITLMIVVLCFIICWIQNKVFFFLPNLGYYPKHNNFYFHFVLFMAFANSTVNPFVYLFKYKDYQKAFLELLKCKRNTPVARDISAISFSSKFDEKCWIFNLKSQISACFLVDPTRFFFKNLWINYDLTNIGSHHVFLLPFYTISMTHIVCVWNYSCATGVFVASNVCVGTWWSLFLHGQSGTKMLCATTIKMTGKQLGCGHQKQPQKVNGFKIKTFFKLERNQTVFACVTCVGGKLDWEQTSIAHWNDTNSFLSRGSTEMSPVASTGVAQWVQWGLMSGPSVFTLRLRTLSQRRSNQCCAAPSCCGVVPLGLYGGCCCVTNCSIASPQSS